MTQGMVARAKSGGKKAAKRGSGNGPLIQYGALPYRRLEDGVAILLVTSRESKRWIIPKGWPEPKMAPPAVAAMEAFEEAGVKGKVGEEPIGSFTYSKKLNNNKYVLCAVTVFTLLVEEELATWRESTQRERRWMLPADAALAVQEPDLAQIFERLDAERELP